MCYLSSEIPNWVNFNSHERHNYLYLGHKLDKINMFMKIRRLTEIDIYVKMGITISILWIISVK